MPEGGPLQITARRTDKAAVVEIRDAGPGISAGDS